MKTFLIAEKDRQRIARFVDVFVSTTASVAVGVPDDMRVGVANSGGWATWKPVSSRISEPQLEALEAQIHMAFPPLFKALLLDRCLLMTDFVVRLPRTPSDAPLRELRRSLRLVEDDSYFSTHGYLPFGDDSNDAGPVCFDTTRRLPDGDCPIVVVDHERIGEPGYAGTVEWPSFAALIDEIEEELKAYHEGRLA